jgi:benzoyl-CoA reductase/2-hydroxyglutaryl-CoA dehydratase subunit BcrC/BadD/HgdB
LFESGISDESVKAAQAQGKKALGVICCHVPHEILYAADALPIRLRATDCVDASDAETWMSSFSCSFAKSILQYWLNGTYDLDGMVATDGCMMASRIYDNAEYINRRQDGGKLVKQYGAPRKFTPRTKAYYKAELEDMIGDLEKLTGNKITDEKLLAAIDKFNEARALHQKVYKLRKAENPGISGTDFLQLTLVSSDMPVDDYIELLKAFLADLPNREPVGDYRARIVLIGSSLDNPEYVKVIEDKGALVVADTLCFGQLAFGPELKPDKADVLGSIAEYYLKRLVCPRMMDKHDDLHQYIIDCVKDYGADGVVYQRMQNCECWGGENILLEGKLKDAGIPLLTVEREEQMANAGQLGIRIEAFVEMIEKEG